MKTNKWLSVQEFIELRGISRNWFYYKLRRKEIEPATRIGETGAREVRADAILIKKRRGRPAYL